MAKLMELAEAVAELVHDGDSVAMEGFTHLIPFAAGHEILRQERKDLTLLRMTPDLLYDQMLGMGCARKLVFSWGGNPGVGSLHRLRDAVENGWPRSIELDEHSHGAMASAYAAGAAGLPFAIVPSYRGTSLPDHNAHIRSVSCPFTGREFPTVAALKPDVAIIHAQKADRWGNVLLWGISGVQKEAVLSSKRALVTVEEIVDELAPVPHGMVLPHWVVSAVALAKSGSQPSYALGYTQRDNDFYRAWDAISKDRSRFLEWMGQNVLGEKGA